MILIMMKYVLSMGWNEAGHKQGEKRNSPFQGRGTWAVPP